MHARHSNHNGSPLQRQGPTLSPTKNHMGAGRTEGAESPFVGSGEDLELRERPESPGYQKQTTSTPPGRGSKAEHGQTPQDLVCKSQQTL